MSKRDKILNIIGLFLDIGSLLMGGWILYTLGNVLLSGEQTIIPLIGICFTIALLTKLFEKYMD